MSAHVLSTTAGVEDVVAVIVLLSEFAMLRAPLLRSQVRLYAFQSLAVSALAVVVAATRHVGDIYVLAGLSFLLKAVIVPLVIMRLLRDVDVDLVGSSKLGVASSTLVALAVSIFGFFSVGSLRVRGAALPTTTLAVASAVVLVGFVLIVLRSDVVSQAMGFFSLENGVSVASLAIAAGLPLVVELTFLFDLLVAVVAFGIIMRVHHGRSKTLSTDELDRLRG
ncbi:MAG: hydrogenase [Actinomycetota bacterium]|nr:hydrogenase [Actinomycetota bacterium]